MKQIEKTTRRGTRVTPGAKGGGKERWGVSDTKRVRMEFTRELGRKEETVFHGGTFTGERTKEK